MSRFFTLLFGVLLVFGCEEKKPRLEITKEKVKEILTSYGKNNPENEVVMETEFGVMKFKLYEDTPLHRANFVKMIKDGIYEDAEFYRIFFQFMIQAGIYPKEFNYTIPPEFNKKYIHKKGVLAMAQSEDDNPDRRSSSTEFFIVQGSVYADYQVENEMQNNKLQLTPEQKQLYMEVGGYMSLDQQYTVFGEMTEGFEVIDKIAAVKVFEQDKPLKKIEVKISVGSSRK